MPLDASRVGEVAGSLQVRCEARRLMSYSAGVPDADPALYDTGGQVRAHPMFPVSPEWELLTSARLMPASMTFDEAIRGVHAEHLVRHHSPVVPGETVTVSVTITGVDAHRAGTRQRCRFDATGADGVPRWTTWMTSLFLGVELVGEPAEIDAPPPAIHPESLGTPVAVATSHVSVLDAHTYTECARIWNPIHTEVAAARSAGLAAPILHGTATMARMVSVGVALARSAGVDARVDRVAAVAGRFAAMVPLGSDVEVRLLGVDDRTLWLDVAGPNGAAIRHGMVELTTK
jgi:acyl dehydratase